MWRRAFLGLSFLGLLSFANGCAVTSSYGGGGCGTGCGDFACGGASALPPVSGHMPGCGLAPSMIGPGCAAPANIACGCGTGCACAGGVGGGGAVTGRGPLARLFGAVGSAHSALAVPNCAAPVGVSCPTCAAPMYSYMGYAPHATVAAPPALAPAAPVVPAPAPALTPAPAAVVPQMIYPPPVDSVPLSVPAPAPAAAAPVPVPTPSTAATAPSAPAGGAADPGESAPMPDSTDPGGFGDDDFGAGGASYYQPRAVRPVNAVPMRNGGYNIQQMSVRQQRGIPMRRVQQATGQNLPVFHLD